MVDELNGLIEAFDEIDAKYGNNGSDRSDPLWTKRVAEKDRVTNSIARVVQKLPVGFPLVTYLISISSGRQVAAVERIAYVKDPTYSDLLCYILLNSRSNYLQYCILNALVSISCQCDYKQLVQIQNALIQYIPPEGTFRWSVRHELLQTIKSSIVFSIAEIAKETYWWRDVESKFFNSLSGTRQYRLEKLYIIRNHRLFDQFEALRYAFGENGQILFVYHGSSHECLRLIAENGFLEPKEAEKASNADSKSIKITILDPGYFGRGIYQAFAADYAIHYSEQYKNSNEIMLSAVLPGRSYTVKKGGEKFGKTGELGFDSHVSPEAKEIILFKSAQILPLFIIRFTHALATEIDEEKP